MSAAKQCFRNLWRASNSVFEGKWVNLYQQVCFFLFTDDT